MQTAPSSRPTCTPPAIFQSCSLSWPISSLRSPSSFRRRACRCIAGCGGSDGYKPHAAYPVDHHNEAETRRVISLVLGLDNPDLSRHIELCHSNCGDAVTLAIVPSDPATTLPIPSQRASFVDPSFPSVMLLGVSVVDVQAATRSRPARAAEMSRRARWTSLGTTCWGARALSRHAHTCGTALWLEFGSCLPGWLACRMAKKCAIPASGLTWPSSGHPAALSRMFGLSSALTQGTAPLPFSSLGTGPLGVPRERTGPGLSHHAAGRRFLRAAPRGRWSHLRLFLRLPRHYYRLRGGGQ